MNFCVLAWLLRKRCLLRDLLVHGLFLLLDHKYSKLEVMWHGESSVSEAS